MSGQVAQFCPQRKEPGGKRLVEITGSCALTKRSRRLELRLYATKGGCLKTSLQRLEECKMLKCLRRILEMRGSAGLYVTTNGTTSLEALGLVCNVSTTNISSA